MGAQDEYLRNFCILLTEKGVVPLTDPLQIAVYRSLLKGMKRPSDLTSELDLSSSSLHFIIDKMVETGIVDRIKPETDKKSVYYMTSAVLLASSTDTSDEKKIASVKTFEDPLKNYKGLSSLANMLDCYLSEIGLDIEPIKLRYANDLADSIEMEKGSIEDAVLQVRDVFSKLTGFNFTVFSFSPLTLVLTGDETAMSKSKVLGQFISRLIENATGRCFKFIGAEAFNGADNMLKMTFERAERAEVPYMNRSLHHRDEQRFLIVELDGSAGLMTSDVQIDIIDAIYERPLCITDIVNKVDSPRSTITSNLLRMVEEGVISVFYSESGSAYYGLACAILARKSRSMVSDNSEKRDVLDAVKDKEGAFMEGMLLYMMACMKKYGFDAEYIMVVLGAKYMRSMGSLEVKGDFDTYFGKMSDMAEAIGLSLNIVSIYPLTIGITTTNTDSDMAQAMTFIKGMAHQGLEMASSGIFVRTAEEENISFKEIYPALSMTPVRGVKVENLGAPTVKKRTSSVKTALLNRSKKSDGKPIRTVRYITAAVFLVLLTAVLIVGLSDTGTTVEADTFSLTVDDDLGATLYDANGAELTDYQSIVAGTVLTLKMDEPKDIGYVSAGIAYLIPPVQGSVYSIKMEFDLHIEQLYDVSEMEEMGCSFSLYSASESFESSAVMPIDSEIYKTKSNGLYVSANNMIRVLAKNGYYIESKETVEGDRLLSKYDCNYSTFKDLNMKLMPDQTKKLDLGRDSYYYGDQIVSGTVMLDKDVTSVQLRLVGDRNVNITANGVPVELDYDNCFTLTDLYADVIKLQIEDRDLYRGFAELDLFGRINGTG